MNNSIRVRFPPSPTGNLHIGNARVALFNYLYTRHREGKFIFRIEDTDFLRSTDEFMQNEIDALRWLSLEWDEGVELGGDFGPYKQSERLDIYNKYVDQLIKTGKAYYCFCSQEQVNEDRTQTGESGESYKYSGRCRDLAKEEIAEKLTNHHPFVIRFKIPVDQEIVTLTDLIRGTMTFPVDGLDDFVMVRSDGIPTYNFAVTIDDATMEISHVIRGEDHLFGNTPRQILLYEALGFKVPFFAHLPMILGSDKTKLSKRHGAFAVTEYREQGFLPQALVNYMALLGWSPKNDSEIFTKDELVQAFEIDHVNVSPAVFDFEKLKWFNAQFLRKLSGEELFKLVKDKIEHPTERTIPAIELLKDHFVLLTDIPLLLQKILSFSGLLEPISYEIKGESTIDMLTLFTEKMDASLEWSLEKIQECIKTTGKELKIKGRALYHPIRLAITNEDQGPNIDVIIFLLGREKTVSILKKSSKVLLGGNHD
jgi:nondiscriminating glutamyl-tRNA synthetase